MLLECLTKRDSCVDDVLVRYGLKTSISLKLTTLLETGPLVSRFSNRVIVEMAQFAEKTVIAYEINVREEAAGPCYESVKGKFWTRCPEDIMSVLGIYIVSNLYF